MQVSRLAQANISSLYSIKQLLLNINDHQYQSVIHPFTASLGKHLRHVAEHYQLLISGLKSGHIDYDKRQRIEIEESERSAMLMRITRICNELEELQESYSGDEQLYVSTAVDEQSETPMVTSCISRELVFLHSHSVHHYAIISAILKLQGIQVDTNFGIASSTLIYEKTQKCAP